MLVKFPSVGKDLVLLKEDFWSLRRLLVNTSVKYRDYKIRQRQSAIGSKITKYKRARLQSAIGLKITKYDRAGLQITIGFGLQSATKIFKTGLQSAMGLQNVTSLDNKLRLNYKARRITKWYSTEKGINSRN